MSATKVTDCRGSSELSANPLLLEEEFKRIVTSLKKMELRERFPLEANAHREMLRREHRGAIIHSALREFRSFLLHVGQRPSRVWTLDRRDPSDPEYAPLKVRWADKRQQANNRQTTVFLTREDGECRPLADWARLTNQNPKTVAKRIERGWTHEEAIAGKRRTGQQVSFEAKRTAPRKAEGWPTGATASMWEAGFRSFTAQFRDRAVPGLTRAVFFAWIGSNRLRQARTVVQSRFPTYIEGYDLEPPGIAEDPHFIAIELYERATSEALCKIGDDAQQHDLLRSLIRQWPNTCDPRRVARLVQNHDD